MQRTAQNGHGVHVVRVLTLLAVLLGLLAMHGLASSHHVPAAAAEHPASSQPHDPAAAADRHATDAVTAAQHPTGPLASPAGPSCDQDCPGELVTLCVAVLAAAAALAAAVVLLRRLRRRLRRRAVAAARAPAFPVPADARAALPPPDPVRELCISRT